MHLTYSFSFVSAACCKPIGKSTVTLPKLVRLLSKLLVFLLTPRSMASLSVWPKAVCFFYFFLFHCLLSVFMALQHR
jgi:hypothetical protein